MMTSALIPLVVALSLAQATGRPPAASGQPAQAPAQTAPAGNAETGKQLFARNGCYECHGLEAQGSTATGPRLAPDPIAFTAFSRYLRKPTGEMPPYTEKVVSEQDLADIYAFLKSVPRPPDPKTLPLPK